MKTIPPSLSVSFRLTRLCAFLVLGLLVFSPWTLTAQEKKPADPAVEGAPFEFTPTPGRNQTDPWLLR